MNNDTSVQVLCFSLNNEIFALHLADVLEVNILPEVLSVHGPIKFIFGFINLHGQNMPVIALDKLLELETNNSPKELFIAVKTKQGPLCILIDELLGFDEYNNSDMGIVDNLPYNIDIKYLKEVCIRTNSMISVLNVDCLVSEK